jgi:ethanolamine transporter EutH
MQIIKISEIPSENPIKIIAIYAWITPRYYAITFMLWIQAHLILEGIRHLSHYPITSSRFWGEEFLYMSLFAFISAAIVGFVVGVIVGCLIAVIYFNNSKIAAQSVRLKFVAYFVNLIPLILLLVVKLPEVLRHDAYQGAWEDLGLICIALAAAAFYTSRGFWRWWIKGVGNANK